MSNMNESAYGVLKHLGELYTEAIGGVTIKLWNVYGVERDPEKSHVITDFIQSAIENNSIKMKTNGEEEREFLYVDDCCDAIITVIRNYDSFKIQKRIDITSFESTKISKIARLVSRASGKKIDIIAGSAKDDIQKNTKNKADKFILNYWKPKTKPEDGIQFVWNELIKDYKEL